MKTNRKKIFLFVLLFSVAWTGLLHGATTAEQYVGEWTGDVQVLGDESEVVSITMLLTLENGSLSGAIKDQQTPFLPFQASVDNGTLVFQWPNMGSPGEPDCVNWDLPATATLNADATVMHLTATGIICSSTGGSEGTVEGDLTKQELSLEKPPLQPMLSILLNERKIK